MTTFKDLSGTSYSSPDNKPATNSTQVKINTSSGTKTATMVGGYAVPNK